MAGCGDCGCQCIVANQLGFPYPVGMDRDGNEAIIVPTPDTRCGLFEFVHGSTTCATSMYPLVAPVGNITMAAAVVVLSEPDNAPVVVAIRVNSVQVASLTVPAGTRFMEWPVVDFPIVLDQFDEVETAVLNAGTVEPAVSIQFTICVPGTVEDAAAAPEDPYDLVLWNPNGRGTLGAGQDPGDIGFVATAPSLAYYRGVAGNHDSLWLVARDTSGALDHRRVWPPDPATVPNHITGWDSGQTAVPAAPEDPAAAALAVDRATNRVTHRWDVIAGGWIALSTVLSQRVELGQAGPHEPPEGPIGYTFFRNAGVLTVDVAGVWAQHTGGPLTVEVVDVAGAMQATITIPAGSRSVVPANMSISVPAGGGLGVRVASPVPATPGSGVTVVGTYSSAG